MIRGCTPSPPKYKYASERRELQIAPPGMGILLAILASPSKWIKAYYNHTVIHCGPALRPRGARPARIPPPEYPRPPPARPRPPATQRQAHTYAHKTGAGPYASGMGREQ